MDIEFRSTFPVDLVQGVGGDDSVLRAMLVSTGKDSTVKNMDNQSKYGRINFLMKNRHGTPFEHNSITFYSEAPIFVYREWHRHRIGISINEQSGRYSELPPIYYIPPPHRPLLQVGKPGAYTYILGTEDDYNWLVEDMKAEAQSNYMHYQRRLARGIAKEVARESLGINIYSKMYWTCNARSLMAFLSLRTNEHESMFPSKPQWEIEQCARQMEDHFRLLLPMTYKAFCENGRVAP